MLANTKFTISDQILVLTSFILITFSPGSGQADENLLRNPGFEAGEGTGEEWGPTVKDWNLTGGAIFDSGEGTWAAADGYRFLGLGEASRLSQTVSLQPQQPAFLTFSMRGVGGGSLPSGGIFQAPPFGVRVFWDSKQVATFSVEVRSPSWEFNSVILPGSDALEHRLEIRDLYSTIVSVDHFSLQALPVPEPRLLALFGLGFAGLFLTRQRGR